MTNLSNVVACPNNFSGFSNCGKNNSIREESRESVKQVSNVLVIDWVISQHELATRAPRMKPKVIDEEWEQTYCMK